MSIKAKIIKDMEALGLRRVGDLRFEFPEENRSSIAHIGVVHKVGFGASRTHRGQYIGSYTIVCGGIEREAWRVFCEFNPDSRVRSIKPDWDSGLLGVQFAAIPEVRDYFHGESYINSLTIVHLREFITDVIFPIHEISKDLPGVYQLCTKAEKQRRFTHWSFGNSMLLAALMLLIAKLLNKNFAQAIADLGDYFKPLMTCGPFMGMISNQSPDEYLQFVWDNLNADGWAGLTKL